MPETTPTLHLELIDKRGSGFIRDGSKGTPNEIELNAPNRLWVPNRGLMCEMQEHEVDGKKIQTPVNVPIRFIRNCNEIREKEQEKMGIKPAFDKSEDMIVFDRSFAHIVREGSSIALFDYLTKVFYNQEAPNRPSSADALFTVVRLDERANQIADDEEIAMEAMKFLFELREKIGKEYSYNEERIDAYCSALNVFADTPAQKFFALMQIAKARPKFVVELLSKLDQITLTEINHALQLGVLKFEGNTAIVLDPERVLISFGAGRLTDEKKYNKLADYLKSAEGGADYGELRARLEVAREKKITAQ